MKRLQRLAGRLLCRIGLHDWSRPLPMRVAAYKHSHRKREEMERICFRFLDGCTARRKFRHVATFTPEQRRRAGR